MNARKHAGFTLVEALIVMGLLGIFLAVLATMFASIVNVQNSSSSSSAVNSDGRFIIARLNYDIARATAITTPASLGSSSATLVMTINAATYTYALNGTNLQLTDGTGPANLNGSRTTVSGLTFQRLGNVSGKESIRYSFTLTGTVTHTQGTDTLTFTSTVERR